MNERVEFDVIINGKKARATLKDVEEDQKRLAKTTVDSNKSMSESWVTLGLKITAAVVAGKAMVQAYEKQFKAETSLQAAMKNNASLMDDNINNWKEYASSIQQWANIGDEVTLQQLAFLNTLGLTDEQMKAIIQTAADVANAGFMPFDSAVRNLAKSLSGMSGELGEQFGVLRELTAEQLKAGEGIKAIAEAVKGQSEAMTNSPVGKWNALWNTAGDTFEKVGKKILGIIDSIGVLDLASKVFEQMSYGMDLLGLRFDWVGEKMKQFWNTITFDTEEANQAQQRALAIEEEWIKLNNKASAAWERKSTVIEQNAVATNLQADATEKAYQAEMDKIYADELAALGLNELGDELEDTNTRLKEAYGIYSAASGAADGYADSIDNITDALVNNEKVTKGSSNYYTTTTRLETPQDYADYGFALPEDYYTNPDYQVGYASGGYTGDVATSTIAGVVHGQEYVVNAQTTKDLGLNGSGGTFDEMNQKLSMLYDVQKSLTKMLRETKENKAYLERIATA